MGARVLINETWYEINEGFAAMKAGKTVRSVIVFDA
jgi:Zn-dependent alcohol dehydrogenase